MHNRTQLTDNGPRNNGPDVISDNIRKRSSLFLLFYLSLFLLFYLQLCFYFCDSKPVRTHCVLPMMHGSLELWVSFLSRSSPLHWSSSSSPKKKKKKNLHHQIICFKIYNFIIFPTVVFVCPSYASKINYLFVWFFIYFSCKLTRWFVALCNVRCNLVSLLIWHQRSNNYIKQSR